MTSSPNLNGLTEDGSGTGKSPEKPLNEGPILLDPDGDVTIILLYYSEPETSESVASEPEAESAPAGDPPESTSENEEAQEPPAAPREAVFRVSKKHMVFASHHARLVLQGGGKEATTIHSDRTQHWTIEPLFDRDAFYLVLQIIHGLTQNIPMTLTLETLAHVAAVVDDLQCEQAVAFFAKLWIQQLRNTVSDKLGPDLGRWILISSVFQDQDLFAKSTKTAVMVSTDSSYANDLPIKPDILDKIESRRVAALDELLSVLTAARMALIGGQPTTPDDSCTFQCRSTLIGGLAIAMSSMTWLKSSSGEAIDYPKISVKSALDDLKNMKSPKTHDDDYSRRRGWSECTLEMLLGAGRDAAATGIEGLRLDDLFGTKKMKASPVVVPT